MSGNSLVVRTAACALLFSFGMFAQVRAVKQKTANGTLEGVVSADGKVRTFKGIPYAAPPVGPLRWKAPQPAAKWTGVRKATAYGPRCMQAPIYSDMIFQDAGPSEDCLYLNLWMPAAPATAKLPVMVWIYGGGFAAGATSEPRQDGGNLSKKGVLVVSMDYRLGIFGFYAHPELAKESGHNAAGNYGLLDQMAALKWVKENIAAFGGDPNNVTIFGESAGSFSVSAQMASPLSKGLFHRAIGESGAFFGDTLRAQSREVVEKTALDFAKNAFGTESIDELRTKSAAEVLAAASKQGGPRFTPVVDGYFLPESVDAIFAAGKQSHVPLLAGWNADEQGYRSVMVREEPTEENFAKRVRTLYPDKAESILKAYSGPVKRAAGDLASDRFIGFGTWKWLETHLETGGSPVFRYRFEQTLPLAPDARAGTEPSAPHASEIEFVFQVLPSRKLPWRPEDRKVSELMGSYWTNFAKTGNPNGEGLPQWPAYTSDGNKVMHLNAEPAVTEDAHRARYLALDAK